MNLVVDYGNTIAKVGIFDQDILTEKHAFNDEKELQSYLKQSRTDYNIVCSVNKEPIHVQSWIEHGKGIILDHTVPLPVEILYSTPSTLGTDRIAGVCGAMKLFPNENTLVIDAGTCITYDFIDQNHKYYGGAISPGLNMRFKAIHAFTSKLPWIEATENPALIGNSTETSIQSGVINGIIAEINGTISLYEEKYFGLRVILTGGNAGFFENKIKASIFAIPELILVGLNSILQHNVD